MMIFLIGSSKVYEERTIHVISDVNGPLGLSYPEAWTIFQGGLAKDDDVVCPVPKLH